MAADLVDLKNWIPGQLWGTVRSNQIDIAKVSKGQYGRNFGSRGKDEAKHRRLVKNLLRNSL